MNVGGLDGNCEVAWRGYSTIDMLWLIKRFCCTAHCNDAMGMFG
jgi:hypothetical protein